MYFDERYDSVGEATWSHFVDSWLLEIAETEQKSFEQSDKVTLLKFFARPEHIWHFIELAIDCAMTDHQLGRIAVDLVETMMGKFGDKYFSRLEDSVRTNEKYSRIVTGVAKYTMSDELWNRICNLQLLEESPLETLSHRNIVIELEKRHLRNLKALKERQGKSQ